MRIVNQPYLVGQHNGVVYLEVHVAPGDRDAVELEKTYAKLRNIEKETGSSARLEKSRKNVGRGPGNSCPRIRDRSRRQKRGCGSRRSEAPGQVIRQTGNTGAENGCMAYVSTNGLRDKTNAVRLAAIINHQGPQIPARVLSKSNGYRVVSGPFADINEAKDAAKRLKIDLAIESVWIRPDKDR